MRSFLSEGIARWAMLVLFAGLPFFFVPLAWFTVAESKALFSAVMLLIAGVAWIVSRVQMKQIRIPKSALLLAALVLPLVYAFSYAMSGFSTLSLVGTGVEQDTLVAATLVSAGLFLSTALFAARPQDAGSALRAFFSGALVLACLGVLHLLIPAFPLSAVFAGQTANAFGNWHEFGILLGFCVFAGVAFFNTPFDEGVWRFVFAAAAILSFVLLIFINLPDIWGALAAVAFLSLLYRPYRMSGRGSVGKPVFWVTLGIVSLLLAFFGGFVWRALPSSLQVTNVEIRPSWQGTFAVERRALNSPATLVFGAGPNTFVRQWSLYKPAVINETQYWNTDFDSGVGSIPTALASVGIVGFLAWVFFIGALLWMVAFITLRDRRDAPGMLLFSLGLGGVYLCIFHVLYTPQVALNVTTFLCIGLFLAYATALGRFRFIALHRSFVDWSGYLFSGVLAVFGLAVIVTTVFAARVNMSEAFVNRSISVFNSTQDITRSTGFVQTALGIYPGDSRAHRAGIELGMLELQRLASQPDAESAVNKAQLQRTLSETIQHGLSAISIDSGDYQNWLELASLYQNLAGAKVDGAYDNASNAYSNALATNPTNPLLYFRMAQLEVLEQKPDAALADIVQAVKLKPDFAAAYYLESQVYAAKSDLPKAAEAATLAVQYAPDDPLGWYNAGVIAYARRDWEGAVSNEQQALARNPQYANALYVLGLAYYNLGRSPDALLTFSRLNQLDPNQDVIEQIISNLEAGKPPVSDASVPAAPATPSL